MKSKLSLSTDRKSASEGEYIEIRWTCDACPDSLFLSIDSGCTQYSIAVSDSGMTRIPVPRSNGKMTVKLIGVISGKKVTESIDVRVKTAQKSRTKAPLSSRMKMSGEKIQAKWYVFRAQLKYWWLSQKKWQKALWIALLALWFGLIFSSIRSISEPEVPSDQVQSGDPSDRRSIITAAYIPAKKISIKTAESVTMTLRECNDLIVVKVETCAS